MDYRTILAFAAVIFAIGYLIRSIQPANALPQGPNVSLGSNPIEHAYSSCNGWQTIFTNNTAQDFIITDISKYFENSYEGHLRVNGQTIWQSRDAYQFLSGLKILSGESVECNSSYSITISGYYTHS